MRAIILAAGQGTRLRPYTDDRPKCMVELLGVPLLHRQLEVLRAAGVGEIVLVGGYRADRLQTTEATLVRNPRFAQTNMVSTLFCAEEWMRPGQDLIVSYGDIVFESKVIESLLARDAPMAVAVDREWRRYWQARMEDPLSDAETLVLEEGNRIVELGKKPQSYAQIQGQYLGLIRIRGDHVKRFRDAWHSMDRDAIYDGKDFDNMYMTSYIQHLIDCGWDARAAFTDNGWLEVDTVADLEAYERWHAEGRLASFIRFER